MMPFLPRLSLEPLNSMGLQLVWEWERDRVIIRQFAPEEAQSHCPTVLWIDQHNRIIEAHPNNKLN